MASCYITMYYNIHFITRGQFWPSAIVIAHVCVSVSVSVCVYESLAGPHDNSSAVQARITKFDILIKMPFIGGGGGGGGGGLWSTLNFKVKFNLKVE